MRILIVKLHALGDLVMATPAIKRLREGLPNARIELLTTDWAEPAIRGSKLVDEVISVPSSLFFSKGALSIVGLTQLLIQIRSRRYDASVAFHISRKIHNWIRLTGISKRFGFAAKASTTSVLLNENRHSALTAWELANLTVTSLGGSQVSSPSLAELRYDWVISDTERTAADKYLVDFGIRQPFATLFPGGGTNPRAIAPERRWPTDGFAELARWLRDARGLKVLLMGGTSDASIAAEVAQKAGEKVENLAGKTDLRTTAAIIARSAIAISNDSAPMHIASAVGTPTLGLFGPTGALTKAPLGDRCGSVSLGLPCSPCYFATFKGCIFDSIRCMIELPAGKVIESAAAILDAPSGVANE